ncbi:MAG: SOS response-associated peptidase family protein [Clostridia bacterium]|nr:SOS response-associated peptidase family protein [Clostridia bacterium]
MCGRYQAWIEDEELVAIIEREKKGNAARFLARSEVFPGDEIPVLYGGGYFLRAKIVKWGYPILEKQANRPAAMTLAGALANPAETVPKGGGRTGLVINARSETAMEKRFFRDDVVNRRVAVPTSGYYEWSPEKQKYHIGEGLVYLAAMTHVFGDTEHAVILTTRPTLAIESIHDRMPLILGQHELESWLYDDYFSREKLKRGNSCRLDAVAV